MPTDDVAVVRRQQVLAITLRDVDIEVIGPEPDHHLVKLTLAVDGAKQGVAGELGKQQAWLIFEKLTLRKPDGLETPDRVIGPAVVDSLGVELLIDETLDRGVFVATTCIECAMPILGAETEGQTLHDMAETADTVALWHAKRTGQTRGRLQAREDRLDQGVATSERGTRRRDATEPKERATAEAHDTASVGGG